MRAVFTIAPDDQDEACDRDQREQRAIAASPEPRHRRRARTAEGDECVGPEKHDQAENEDCQTHAILATHVKPFTSAAVEDSRRQCK